MQLNLALAAAHNKTPMKVLFLKYETTPKAPELRLSPLLFTRSAYSIFPTPNDI